MASSGTEAPLRLEQIRSADPFAVQDYTETSADGVVTVKSMVLQELTGDGDGYADTNETVDVTFVLHNPLRSSNLTNVLVRLDAIDPKVDCIETPSAWIASLPAGSDAPVTFRLHVHPSADRNGAEVHCQLPGPGGTCSNFAEVPGGCVADADCRVGPGGDYSAKLLVSVTSDEFPVAPRPPEIASLTLDLNSDQPVVATVTYSEGFEGGFGSFTFQNLDVGKATNTLSDGYRCQYNDPDSANSNSYGETICYLGFPAGQSPVNDWHVHTASSPDGGRAFGGTRSLHYGRHVPGNPAQDTYPLAQLDAIRSKSTLPLASRVCAQDPAQDKRACNSAADCVPVGGGPCISATPLLSFKHQISLVDERTTYGQYGAPDRGVAQVLVAGSSTWAKLFPFENIYDQQPTDDFGNCSFDSIDDGNDEDDYFDPTDPRRRLGPSSTCFPEFVFDHLGDTDEPFNSANTGRASDGPGLPGSLGGGTWVESRFDLSPFRGRSIQIRFLVTSIRSGDNVVTWNDFHLVQTDADDGWYLDDVRVTQSLGTASATTSVDGADNDALPGNLDGDARGDACDCALADPGFWALPGHVELSAWADRTLFGWEPAAPEGGTATSYDVLRGRLEELPAGAGVSEVCIASDTDGLTVTDAEAPPEGRGFWYLVRGRNACGSGSYGFATGGVERQSGACP